MPKKSSRRPQSSSTASTRLQVEEQDFDDLVSDAIRLEEQGDRYASDYYKSMRLYGEAIAKYRQALSSGASASATDDDKRHALYNLGRLMYIRVSKMPQTGDACARRLADLQEAIGVLEQSMAANTGQALAGASGDMGDSEDTDALFNYGQALILRGELAEEMNDANAAVQSYLTAATVFALVRRQQEAELQSLRQDSSADTLQVDTAPPTTADTPEFVYVMEQSITTPESLIDTLLAHIDALTHVLDTSPGLTPSDLAEKVHRYLMEAEAMVASLPPPPPKPANLTLSLSASDVVNSPRVQVLLARAHFLSICASKVAGSMADSVHDAEALQRYQEAIAVLDEVVRLTNSRHVESLVDLGDCHLAVADLEMRASPALAAITPPDTNAYDCWTDAVLAPGVSLDAADQHVGNAWRSLAAVARAYHAAVAVEPEHAALLAKFADNETRRAQFHLLVPSLVSADTCGVLLRNAQIFAERCWAVVRKSQQMQPKTLRPFDQLGAEFAKEAGARAVSALRANGHNEQAGLLAAELRAMQLA
ncbi:hypothetical protein RI367_007500 [Sorochytrium milnesiophthora]